MAWPRGWQRRGEKGSDSGYIVNVEMTGFAEGLEGGERRTGVEDSSHMFDKTTGRMEWSVVLVV